jgi:hypothetical protein
MMENFEILVRSILIRPDQPAVLLLGHFSPQVHQTHGFAGPDHWHSIVAQFYDIPHVSIKSAVFPEYMKNPNSVNKYYVDPVLASVTGHDLITDILVAYMQTQICTAWSVAHGNAFDSVPCIRQEIREMAMLYSAVLGKEKAFQSPTRRTAKKLMLTRNQ